MQILLEVIRNGWPDRREDVPHQSTPYFDVRDTLSHEDGVVLKGERVVIPMSLRPEMTRRLHAAHMAYDSMMARARETIFWPRMSSEVKQVADCCEVCQQMKPKQRNEPLMCHKDGDGRWRKIGVDLFYLNGTSYLLTIDYFSGFMEVDKLSSTTSCKVIDKLKGHFGRYGIPLQLVNDNAPECSSREFKRFAQLWKFEHATSSPMYPRSNGKAEAGVKLAKNTLRKTMSCGGDVQLALLELRNTPRHDAGMSAAKMMFGRQTHSLLPTEDNETVKVKKAKRRQSVKKHHDKTAHSLKEVHEGQPI